MPSPTQITDELWAQRSDPKKAKAPPDFLDEKFTIQKQLLLDAAPLLVVLCTRRAAKSFSAAKRLLRAMYKHPGCSCLFIALTRDSAKKIIWKDVLKVINKQWRLGAKFNETDLTMRLPNGSVLYILGVDTTDDEKEKLLGQKYAEVAIDEGASYSIDLYELIYGVLKPAVADYRGTIGVYGTPGNLKGGLFFKLTKGQNPSKPNRWRSVAHESEKGEWVTREYDEKGRGWSGHCWSTAQNPYMAEKWAAEIAELVADNPLIRETPSFQQNYLGLWVIDDSKLVYRYLPTRNDFNGTLPAYKTGGEWHFVLAIDLGFTDATSFTVCAYHDHDRTLYVLESFKRAELDITAKAEVAAELKRKWPIEQTVIDGANKDAVAELNNRHGLEAEPADKTGKADFIDIMNAEFIQERIKLSPDCQPLKDEYAGLIWDERKLVKLKREEHPGCENHCTDGTLYGWRFCWQYLSVELKPKPQRNTQEYFAAQQAAQQQELDEAMEAEMQRNKDELREEVDQWA